MMYDILQFLVLMLNVVCALYYSYQSGKLKGLSIAVTAALNHRKEASND